MIQQNGGGPGGVDGLDNLLVIGLELCDIGSGCLQVLLDLLKYHF
jgi:hypothetical protein